jgi:protoporphyrinogen/coproporphyrinogen III oxidase
MRLVATERERRALVVGSGPAGAAAAHALRRRGYGVTVLEGAEQVGGRTATLRHDGFTIDTGAFYLGHFYERSLELASALGIRDSLVPMERLSGLYDGERVRPWRPASPLSLLKLPRARLPTKLRAFAVLAKYGLSNLDDPFELGALAAADDGRTVAGWSRRLMGTHGYRHVVQPTFEPYWLYGADEGSSLAFTAFLPYTPKLQLFALPRGTASFCEDLLRDVDVELGAKVGALEVDEHGVVAETEDGTRHSASGAVVATDAHDAARIVPDRRIAAALGSVPYAANVHVSSAYRLPDGVLARLPATVHAGLPREEPVATISLLSRKAPGLVPPGWEVVDVYFNELESRRLDGRSTAREAHEHTRRILDVELPDPAFAHVLDRDRAIVKPPPGHFATMLSALRELPPRVALAGDYLSLGIIEGAVRSGESAAERLDAELARRAAEPEWELVA